MPSNKPAFAITWLEDRSDDGLLSELRRVAALMPDGTLTTDAFDSKGRITASAIGRRFGSWSEAKRRAGLAGARPGYASDAILEDLKAVSITNPDAEFTARFYVEHGGKYSASLIKRRFGGWLEGLAAAGIRERYVGPSVSERMRAQPGRAISDDELVRQIRKLAARLGKHTLTGAEIDAHTGNGGLIWARFGTIAEALRRAGIQQGRLGRRHSEDAAFRNLFEMWVHYGRAPTHTEMDRPPSSVGSQTYINRYGGWRKALKAFVQRANSEADGDLALTQPSVSGNPPTGRAPDSVVTNPDDKRRVQRRVGTPAPLPRRTAPGEMRQPSIGLRFRVMSRDRFRCRRCGRSPATDPICVLHLDHIVPWSKGGKTTLENLEALCAECNVGKSNRSE